jgi:hypothetical protein
MANANTTQAKSLRNQIDLLAAEYRVAEQTETRAELRNRKARIQSIEGQLTELGGAQ